MHPQRKPYRILKTLRQGNEQVSLENLIGEVSALSAAFCFSLASTTFTLAGRKFGASASMALSLLISLACLLPIHHLMLGEVFPMSASLDKWLLLASSSLAGFVISSLLLLRSFQYIGPRLAMLVGASTPIFAALMAWIFLGQGLPTYALIGITLVTGGIFWVISEDAIHSFKQENADYAKGLLMAIASAIGQGASFVLMSEAMTDGFHAMSASLIRTLVGVFVLWVLIALRGKLGHNLKLIAAEPKALLLILLASISGPVIGATLVLLSLQFTSVGISSTLTGTTPILLIPIAHLVFGERITSRAVFGTIVAIIGVAFLFAA